MIAGWEVGAVTLKMTKGDVVVPGWIKGQFTLDCRVSKYSEDIGWAVTHRQTGFLVTIIEDDLPAAHRFVAQIEALGDWDFRNPGSAKEYESSVKEALNSFPHNNGDGWGAPA